MSFLECKRMVCNAATGMGHSAIDFSIECVFSIIYMYVTGNCADCHMIVWNLCASLYL